MKIRLLTASDIRTALPMDRAIEVMRTVFSQLSAGNAEVPLRGRLYSGKGVTLLMPAYLKETQAMAVKIVSIYDQNPTVGLPTVTAMLLVLDPQTGLPQAFMEAHHLTAVRTGATGGLAADLLARKDARHLALFGAGVQGRAGLEAVRVVRNLDRVFVYDPVREASAALAAEIAQTPSPPRVEICDTPRKAVSQADIVITVTTSKTPVFDGNDLRPGAHVTAVGSFSPEVQEVDAVTIERAVVVADSREACLAEAGDLIACGASVDAELGEVVNRTHPGRTSDDQITYFKTVGIAAQDAAAAAEVLRVAEKKGLGQVVDLG
jgi:ornithine cyclodeaminase/alanine dehydrogenase-like protein (mu-crystallin family)